eukprot:c22490_g2_i1 orf=2-211(-)
MKVLENATFKWQIAATPFLADYFWEVFLVGNFPLSLPISLSLSLPISPLPGTRVYACSKVESAGGIGHQA